MSSPLAGSATRLKDWMAQPLGRFARSIWLMAAAVLVVALALGYTAGAVFGGPSYPGDSSPEAGFARDMSEHHAQAVELGMIAFQHATLSEVRELGGDIALTQQGQIGEMQTWLRTWGLSPNTTHLPMAWMPGGHEAVTPGHLMPGMATAAEVARLRAAKGRAVDVLFCQLMLKHHLGGIHMVEGILALTHDQRVHDLAQGMKDGQLREVDALRSLLTKLGGQP
jgi:uncharacterized protein (DUF305 family)